MSAPKAEEAWRRVAVVGSSGVGKSTMARRLAGLFQSEPIELDALYFEPGWRPRAEAAFRDDVAVAVAQDRWVIDGNYRVVRDLVWGRATAIVWLDYSLTVCLSRTARRCVRRAWTGERVCGENRETFRQSFASRDSLLLYVLQTHASRRRETGRDLDEGAWAGKPFVRHRTLTEAARWIEDLEASSTASPQ